MGERILRFPPVAQDDGGGHLWADVGIGPDGDGSFGFAQDDRGEEGLRRGHNPALQGARKVYSRPTRNGIHCAAAASGSDTEARGVAPTRTAQCGNCRFDSGRFLQPRHAGRVPMETP